jgi:hypothetical protein
MLKGETGAILPNDKKKVITGKIERNLAEGETSTSHKEYLVKQIREEAKREEERAREQALFQARLAAIAAAPASASTLQQEQQPEPSPPLSEIIKIYLDEGERFYVWFGFMEVLDTDNWPLYRHEVGRNLPLAS